MRRGGTSLVEMLLALMLVCGPMLVGVQLIQANVRWTSRLQSRMLAQVALDELLARLATSPLPQIRAAVAEDASVARESLNLELKRWPPRVREALTSRAASLARTLHARLDEDVSGYQGLHLLVLSLDLPDGQRVVIRQLVAAR